MPAAKKPVVAKKVPVKSASTKKAGGKKKPVDANKEALIASTPKNFRVGGDIRFKRDLSRFVRWPKYIRLQRQRKIIQQRLKVPPALNQFKSTLNKNQAAELFRLLDSYKPETKAEKKIRLAALAKDQVEGKAPAQSKPKPVLKFGINHVVDLIEDKKAKLVVIAADVDPIELVVYLPALCRMQNIPYVIVKSKARLGQLVHLKTATAVVLTAVEREHEHKLNSIVDLANTNFNKNKEVLRKWGGGVMGLKTQRALEIRAKVLAAEQAKKAMY